MADEQNKSPTPHTPLPWAFIDGTITTADEVFKIADPYCMPTVDTAPGEMEANADFIVRACNSHYELLTACEEFVRKVDAGEARSRCSYRQMRDAIAKARGH
jgi:hypothetical protein